MLANTGTVGVFSPPKRVKILCPVLCLKMAYDVELHYGCIILNMSLALM